MVQFNNNNICNKYEKRASDNHISYEKAFLVLMQKKKNNILMQLLLFTIISVIVVLHTS